MENSEPRPPSPSQLSKTPSWISLGFILGVLFIWFLPKPPPEVIEVPVKDETPAPLVATRSSPDFTKIEAVFALWDRYAVWDNDLTEVALWDIEIKKYAHFYEIRRAGDNYYYRSIARLTRPVLTHGVDTNAPLLFTEPDFKRQEWLQQRDAETWKEISDSIQKIAPPDRAAPKPQ
jgi:hypothetical protein